jgi:hypothetical protein
MPEIIDNVYRQKLLNDPTRKMLEGMSDDDLRALQSTLEQNQVNDKRQMVGRMAGNLSDILLQRGGIKPPQREKGNDLNDFITKEMVKQQIKGKIEVPQGETPPGLWRDPSTGKIYKVPIEPIQNETEKSPMAIPQASVQENIPQNLWRDPTTGRIYKITSNKQTIQEKEQAKQAIKETASRKIAEQNINVIGGSLNRLAQTYVDAYNEKGIGNLGRKYISGAAIKVGGSLGDKYPNTAAFPGQKIEVITKMMPLLTQQGDKPGSVRLVQTVFDKLMGTLPGENTGPEAAKRMMTTTIGNMFGFAKAIKDMNVTNEQVENLNDNQLKQLGATIEQRAKSITLTPEERQQLDYLVQQVLAPFDTLTGQPTKQNIPTQALSNQEEDPLGLR